MSAVMKTLDGNEATAYVAHKTNEVCIIYPITPSSGMGEWADQWSSENRKNLWDTVPEVIEMQSEGGAAGALHGALQSGSVATTFTASQGLLLMIPNMYKIAGELTPCVFHVSARTIATHALSIFGDHSDVMAVRATGFGLLASASVQEAHDMALISQAATLKSRIPFVHFFDGFRTSHEVNKIHMLSDETMRAMIDDQLIFAHRERALSPNRPVLRGTAQNPDVFFQARETINPFYAICPTYVQEAMDKFAGLTGRSYHLFDYAGDPDAELVIVAMGSGAVTAVETARHLAQSGEKVGVVNVHLYRPFSVDHFIKALPASCKRIAVLDRTKEPGATGEPLYQDVVTSLAEVAANGELPMAAMPRVINGRYGLSSKEFTPAMVKAIFDELKKDKPKNHFTIGINDDVTNSSLEYDPTFDIEPESVVRALFYGLGADGTVSANKNSIKIIGEETDNFAQAYFVYDSKKSGSQTTSHLRFGPEPIHAPYLLNSATFIGCHQFNFIYKVDMLKSARKGGVFLLNSPYGPEAIWENLPPKMQKQIIEKKLEFYIIDAFEVARQTKMGVRINTIMQTCFFAISGVLPRDEAIAKIKQTIEKTFGKKGEEVVQSNYHAVDQSIANLHKVAVPAAVTATATELEVVPAHAPDFVKRVTAQIMAGYGDDLPVSAFAPDGTFPTGTTAWEKRGVSHYVPQWDSSICVRCGNCALVCPHGVIRAKALPEAAFAGAPQGFKTTAMKGKGVPEGTQYTLGISVEDCTGCGLCVRTCPAKNKEETGKRAINMVEKVTIQEAAHADWDFFAKLPETDLSLAKTDSVRGIQFLQPLFEFSGACAGCGETPYVKMFSQLFGDRTLVANATGCSSIYGGNLPTTPWTTNAHGRGPAWSNSLFEDNAEFGFGFRANADKQGEYARELLVHFKSQIGEPLVSAILEAPQVTIEDVAAQRERVAQLMLKLDTLNGDAKVAQLKSLAEYLVKRSIWIVGGDGWAYDIGYGGLDHVIASGRNINILVLDTEVYSNTGGQASKATPRGAVAKFAAGGKLTGKKDLGMIAMTYGNVYVAKIAFGANARQAIQAFVEAEAYPGPSLILAYSHCIAHGYNLEEGLDQQQLAVECGHWPLFRYNPLLTAEGKNPLTLDSERKEGLKFSDYALNEIRYKMLQVSKPEESRRLMTLAQQDVDQRWELYQKWASQ